MRQRLVLWTVLGFAAAAIGSGDRAARADGGTTKSYPDKNFKWALPPGWALEEAEGENKEAGYVCIARKELDTSKTAAAYVRVVDAGKASLDSLVALATKNKSERLDEPDATPPGKVDWAGMTDARYVQLSGKVKGGGVPLAHRLYSAIVDGKFHQLDIRTYNGVESELMSDIDAVAAGYHVLKGGGGRASGGSEGGGEMMGDGGDPAKARFDKLALTWTLPRSPDGLRSFAFTQKAPADVETPAEGNTDIAQASLQGEGPEVVILVQIQKVQPGGTAKGFINNDKNFEVQLKENFEGTPIPNLDEDVVIGNWRGSRREFTGKDKGGKPLYIRNIFSVLRDTLYWIRVVAHDKGETPGGLPITQALAGLKWDDASEGVRGPVMSEFPPVTSLRENANPVGKEATLFYNKVYTLKKPAAFSELKYVRTDPGFAQTMVAMEARKPGTYMFFGIKRFTVAQLKSGTPPQTPESILNEHESGWKNLLGEPKTLQKDGKSNKVSDKVAGAKGFRYEFSGEYERHPYLERGWFVTAGTNVLWVKIQYGGKGAEQAFSSETSSILASIKWE